MYVTRWPHNGVYNTIKKTDYGNVSLIHCFLEIRRKSNVLKTLRRLSGPLLKMLSTLNLHSQCPGGENEEPIYDWRSYMQSI